MVPAPPGFAWRMADNSSLELDAAGLVAMARTAGGYVFGLRAVMWAKLGAIGAAATPEAVAAVDPTAGWPG